MARPELSLVIPIYNEEEVLPTLDQRLKTLLGRLGMDAEVIFVDDGSKDRSLSYLRDLAGRDGRYRIISFSRNFGHQRAISAGMDKSRGHAVVVMDADLQDPPEVIQEMIGKWREGYDVVYGRRRSRKGESFFKLVTAKLFYRLFAALIPIEVPLDTGDFRLMSRRVVTAMRSLRESHRFVRGLVAWVGFKQTAVEYDRSARVAGETKYPLRKMIAFALDGIASFSIQPLRFATYVGALVGIASVLYGLVAIASYLMGATVQGWTTTVVLVSFLFSVQFFMIGVLGEYVGRIYEQVKKRPLYVVAERINFNAKRPRVPRNVESTQEVALITTSDSVAVVGVPERPSRQPERPSRKTEEPMYFPKTSTEVHTLFGHTAPEPKKPSAPPAMTLHVPVERGFSAPNHPPAPIPPDATAEIPLVTAKVTTAIPPLVTPVQGTQAAQPMTTERGLGALAMLERRARSAPPTPIHRPSEPPEPAPTPMPILSLSADDTAPPMDSKVIELESRFVHLELPADKPGSAPPPPGEPKRPSSSPTGTIPPGDVPPPPAALTAALEASEAAFNRSVAASRPPPALRPSIAEVPLPDAPRPAPLDLSASIGALPSAPPVEPPTELPPVVETRPPAPAPTGRPRPTGKPPNVTARLAALKPEASKAPRESERVPDTAKSAVDEGVQPKPRVDDSSDD